MFTPSRARPGAPATPGTAGRDPLRSGGPAARVEHQHASPAPLLPPTRSLYGAPGASRAAAAGGMGMGGGEAPFSSPFGATQARASAAAAAPSSAPRRGDLTLTRQVSSPPDKGGGAGSSSVPRPSLFSPAAREEHERAPSPSPMQVGTPTAVATPQAAALREVEVAAIASGAQGDAAPRVRPEADGSAWVTAFGFAPEETNAVLRALEACGDVLRWVPPAGRANWAHAHFRQAHEAQAALRVNGAVLGRGLMVGVRPLESAQRCEIEAAVDSGVGGAGAMYTGAVGGGALAMARAPVGGGGGGARPYRLDRAERTALPTPETSLSAKIKEYLLGW